MPIAVPTQRYGKFADSPLEEDEFGLSVPDFEGTFSIRPGAWTCRPPRESEPNFDDRQRQGYRPPSQADPGNDIHAGSPSLPEGANARPRQPGAIFLGKQPQTAIDQTRAVECLTKRKTRALHATEPRAGSNAAGGT